MSTASRAERRFARGLVVALCLVGLVATGCGERRSRQQSELGYTYLEIGRVNEAEEAFRRALELDPGNVSAREGSARCLALQQKPEEALAAYMDVLERDPLRDPAYYETVRLLAVLGRPGEAEELARRYESVDAERGGILRAYVMRAGNRGRDAVELLAGLRGRFPQSVMVRLNLATAYVAVNDLPAAEAELRSIIDELDPNSAQARMALVEVFHKQGKIGELITQLRTMAEQRPADIGVRLALARSLLDSGEIEEAESIARPILEDIPESAWANYVVGSCLVARQAYADAIPYLQTAAQGLPDQDAVTERLAFARRGGADTPVAVASPEPGAPDAPTPVPAQATWRDLWASARLRDLLDARAAVLASGAADARETLTLAAVFSGANAIAEELATGLPDDSSVRAYLGALKEREPARFREVMDQWPKSEDARGILRENALGFGLMLIGARGQASAVLSECVRRWPENGVALYNMGSMYRAAGMPQFAAQVFDRLLLLAPENLEARRLRFSALLDAGNLEEARSAAELTYSLFPTDKSAILDLARIYHLYGETALSLNVLQKGIRSLPDDPTLLLSLSDAHLLAGEPQTAADLLAQVQPPAELATRFAMARALAAADLGDWDTVARECAAVAADERPLSMRPLYAAALAQAGRAAEAVAALDGGGDALGLFSAALGATVGGLTEEDRALAQALSQDRDALSAYGHGLSCALVNLHPSALQAFERAAQAAPKSPRLVSLKMASLTEGKGIRDREQRARALAENHADLPAAWIGLTRFYEFEKSPDKERAALDRAYEVGASDPDVLRLRAQFMERMGNLGEAQESYRRLAALLPEDPAVMNNLAYMILENRGDLNEALALAQGAIERLGNNPHVLHTLGLAELRAGQLDGAERHLAMAVEMRPGDPTLLLDFGQLLVARGREEDGRRYAQVALFYAERLGLNFPRHAEARALAGSE